jgi:hypothetical protein
VQKRQIYGRFGHYYIFQYILKAKNFFPIFEA